MARYKIGCVVVDPGEVGEQVIGQITSSEMDEGFERFFAADSGGLYPEFSTAAGRLRPAFTFTTQQIKTALGECELDGLALGTKSVDIYLLQFDSEGNTVAAGAKKVTISKGMMLLRSINAGTEPPVTCTYEIIPCSSDGTSAPWNFSDSQTPPAEGTQEVYVLGGSDLYQSATVNTGIAEVLTYGDGKPYPQDIHIDHIAPVVTITKANIDDLGDKAVGSIQFTDCTDAGIRSDAPLTLTFNKEDARVQNIGGGRIVGNTVVIPCLYDGTNAPIVFTGLT